MSEFTLLLVNWIRVWIFSILNRPWLIVPDEISIKFFIYVLALASQYVIENNLTVFDFQLTCIIGYICLDILGTDLPNIKTLFIIL